ncbi:hypothetical protein K413DRAFT_0795 [Clostridium sp. ASBs410]|nr:hypothetical protein K413DRAFT_0795 [Clostridium sp. ASBs410]
MEITGLLLRFFEKEEYVRSFRSGDIRMMSIEYYRKMYETFRLDYDNRFDSYENIQCLTYNPFFGSDMPENMYRVTESDGTKVELAACVKEMRTFSPELDKRFKISSYYEIDFNKFNREKLSEAIDSMEDNLGNYYCLIVDPAEFVRRINCAMKKLFAEKRALRYKADRTEYVDEKAYNGYYGPFRKPKGLSWQNEYRLLIDTVDEKDPFWFQIGDLTDISVWGIKQDLRESYVDSKGIFKGRFIR